jgi:hypothetical protein
LSRHVWRLAGQKICPLEYGLGPGIQRGSGFGDVGVGGLRWLAGNEEKEQEAKRYQAKWLCHQEYILLNLRIMVLIIGTGPEDQIRSLFPF